MLPRQESILQGASQEHGLYMLRERSRHAIGPTPGPSLIGILHRAGQDTLNRVATIDLEFGPTVVCGIRI